MKTSNSFVHGELREDCYEMWAQALVEYALRITQETGVPVLALSAQNEPRKLFFLWRQTWETMFFSPTDWAKFGARVSAASRARGGPKMLVGDDQHALMPDLALPEFQAVGAKRTWAVGVHNYEWPAQGLTKKAKAAMQLAFPDTPVVVTEFCTGFSSLLSYPLGRDRGTRHAAQFMLDLMRSLSNAGATGYVDWNMILDEQGGPNWAKNFVDSAAFVSGLGAS